MDAVKAAWQRMKGLLYYKDNMRPVSQAQMRGILIKSLIAYVAAISPIKEKANKLLEDK